MSDLHQPSAPTQQKRRLSYLTQSGAIAAVYAVFTVITIALLQGLAIGPIQLRVSEALTSLPLLTAAAVPGLTIGCLIANLIGGLISGVGALSFFDVIFGSIATLLGALWARKFKERPLLALLGPVLANALIVPAYLPILMAGYGFYTIPFTSISLQGSYVAMYLFGVISVGVSEAIVVYALGYPLYKAIKRIGIL